MKKTVLALLLGVVLVVGSGCGSRSIISDNSALKAEINTVINTLRTGILNENLSLIENCYTEQVTIIISGSSQTVNREDLISELEVTFALGSFDRYDILDAQYISLSKSIAVVRVTINSVTTILDITVDETDILEWTFVKQGATWRINQSKLISVIVN